MSFQNFNVLSVRDTFDSGRKYSRKLPVQIYKMSSGGLEDEATSAQILFFYKEIFQLKMGIFLQIDWIFQYKEKFFETSRNEVKPEFIVN